eukprot:gene39-172_t
MVWDDTLASDATAYARQCRVVPDATNKFTGENIHASSNIYNIPKALMEAVDA